MSESGEMKLIRLNDRLDAEDRGTYIILRAYSMRQTTRIPNGPGFSVWVDSFPELIKLMQSKVGTETQMGYVKAALAALTQNATLPPDIEYARRCLEDATGEESGS